MDIIVGEPKETKKEKRQGVTYTHMSAHIYLSLSLSLSLYPSLPMKPLSGFYTPVSKPYKIHVEVKLA